MDSLAHAQRFGDGYHTLWECYSPEETAPATRWDGVFLSRQDFVGWTGLGPIAMLYENILGLDLRGAENRIVWDVARTDRHGVENLLFRGQPVSLVAAPQADGSLRLRASAREPFTLELRHRGRTTVFKIPAGKTTLQTAGTGSRKKKAGRAGKLKKNFREFEKKR